MVQLRPFIPAPEIVRPGTDRPYQAAVPLQDFSKGPPAPYTRAPSDEPAMRKCLRCRGNFESEGWGNRMCVQCRRTAGMD